MPSSPSSLSPAEVSRYHRQISLAFWGLEAQERVKSSRVLMAGAGGVASCAAVYLIAGGLGAMRLVDQSRVSLSDLNHHILYRERDLGKPRAATAESRLKELNPFAIVESRDKTISGHNISWLTKGCHLIVDALNQTQVGEILNQAAVRRGIPLIVVQMQGTKGHLTTFWAGNGPCRACVFPEPPISNVTARGQARLGPVSGILGTLVALEALCILGGLGPALCGRMLTFDAADFLFTQTFLRADSRCPVCQREEV
ncbi:MAG: HesA/MoeB/ThiF family protein [Deltaproteobacteria bacterium]|nr:HesA/MoeB/ThiF family protein [Deltaproteobacteria bacterium]